MSVDETIRELSGTLNQLGVLVGKINEQISGISGRINVTLQNFDDSVAGIANDANKMTDQMEMTIGQIPGSWAFYLLFFTLIAVLVLLSIFIIINLIVKMQSICRTLRGEPSSRLSHRDRGDGDTATVTAMTVTVNTATVKSTTGGDIATVKSTTAHGSSTPLQSLVHSEAKQPLHHAHNSITAYPGSSEQAARLRHHQIAVEMEAEPRRYGLLPDTSQHHHHHHHQPPQPTPTSRATVAATTVLYHPGQQQQQMRRQSGASPAGSGSELRERSDRSSPNSRSQPAGAYRVPDLPVLFYPHSARRY